MDQLFSLNNLEKMLEQELIGKPIRPRRKLPAEKHGQEE